MYYVIFLLVVALICGGIIGALLVYLRASGRTRQQGAHASLTTAVLPKSSVASEKKSVSSDRRLMVANHAAENVPIFQFVDSWPWRDLDAHLTDTSESLSA
jgi:hypothetical protein